MKAVRVLLENGGKFMVTINAIVENNGEKVFIKITTEDHEIKIPISEDDPNEVKAAFNLILLRLKKGPFDIKLQNQDDDLFVAVAKEYLQQLNSEIMEIYGVMESNGLISTN